MDPVTGGGGGGGDVDGNEHDESDAGDDFGR